MYSIEKRNTISPLYINDTEVEPISTFKFIGTLILDDLNWMEHKKHNSELQRTTKAKKQNMNCRNVFEWLSRRNLDQKVPGSNSGVMSLGKILTAFFLDHPGEHGYIREWKNCSNSCIYASFKIAHTVYFSGSRDYIGMKLGLSGNTWMSQRSELGWISAI